ncbi:Cystathionine gamma-synthase [Knufia obscura]|uniref:cystathionine gamma-synthase n=2 Tax=Knufia TaxID=430999 RepID=A0AAN8FG46_9EURO|nr:Cystathionine gamma-synthase [Knufia obscura]KAK5957896.1 Cystathionine gamma-synthase [Knufia fluminis]
MLAAVGRPVPDIPHATSVSLPTWRSNVGYEEGEEWVVSKMQTGYPRFFIHLIIQELEKEILSQYGRSGERVMLFPSRRTAQRCQAFFQDKRSEVSVRLLHLEPTSSQLKNTKYVLSKLSCVFFPADEFPTAKQVWQHSGSGISSRRGEFCLKALKEGYLVPVEGPAPVTSSHHDLFSKGPRRYQRGTSQSGIQYGMNGHIQPQANGNHVNGSDFQDQDQFIEERFGRNLNAENAARVKLAIRRRIAGSLTEDLELDDALAASESGQQKCQQDHNVEGERLRYGSEDDVYLYPTGMNAIFSAHLLVMEEAQRRGRPPLKSVCFGFPYIDTLKVLEKWGPGAKFYGNGTDEDLDDLERRLESGERFAALFTEFPSNPLLRSPNLARIRQLGDKYDFVVVVDETVGNYININVLPHADIVVSSLTKIFTGECNVMGGSLVLNHSQRLWKQLNDVLQEQYEDNYWAEDAVFMERNSRDFVSRIERINVNAEATAATLQKSPFVKEVYYPSLVPSKKYYDACKTPNGGYGGLLSVTFHNKEHAPIFFDNLAIQKGPSLGTNFSLSCPFVLLAHYNELDWVQQFGVDPYLVRISVGLEDPAEMNNVCEKALEAITQS